MFYRPDGTSSYVSIMQVTGATGPRRRFRVPRGRQVRRHDRQWPVDGCQRIGSGKLAGLTGKARSDSTHDDYPFMPLTLDYDLG